MPQSLTFAARIIDELQSIRPLCPTFGPPLCVAGQIEHFVFGRPEGLPHIEQAFRLAPYDRTVCFIAGKLAVEAGDWDQSLAAFKRCAALSGFDSEMIDIYVAANRPDLALKIAEGKRQELSYLANRLQGDPHDQDIAAYCQSQATALLLVEAEQPDASAEAMAEMAARYAEQNNPAQAIDWYRKALRLNYGAVDWRLRLAGILAGMGHVSRAMEEARICLRLRPQCAEAQKMISDLSIRKDAVDGAGTGPADGANRAADAALGGLPTR